jgi:hypothetical protein
VAKPVDASTLQLHTSWPPDLLFIIVGKFVGRDVTRCLVAALAALGLVSVANHFVPRRLQVLLPRPAGVRT